MKQSLGSCWSHSSKGHVQRSALNIVKDRLSTLYSVLPSHTPGLHGCSTVQDYDMRSFGIGVNGRRQCKSTPQLSVRKSGVYADSHSHTTAIAINTLRQCRSSPQLNTHKSGVYAGTCISMYMA